MQNDFTQIERKLGYTFSNRALLEEAFTHTTYAHLHGGKNNERLEFLGDTVLQFVVTDYLYAQHPNATEGELTALRARFVCEQSLLETVDELSVGGYLRVEGGEANVGKKTIASLYETVLGAIYLDGGYEKAKSFVFRTLLKDGDASKRVKDGKTRLQEYLQGIGEPPPRYQTEQEGKDNAPTFHCTVFALGRTARGVGGSKKAAEKQAAEKLLVQLKKRGDA